MKKQLPPPTPPYTGGEPNARKHRDATTPHLLPLPKDRAMDAQMHHDAILPLCKGEPEGVVAAPAPCGRNHKSQIINLKSKHV